MSADSKDNMRIPNRTKKTCVFATIVLASLALVTGCTAGEGRFVPKHAIQIAEHKTVHGGGQWDYLIPREYVAEADQLKCGSHSVKTAIVVSSGDIQVHCDLDTDYN